MFNCAIYQRNVSIEGWLAHVMKSKNQDEILKGKKYPLFPEYDECTLL